MVPAKQNGYLRWVIAHLKYVVKKYYAYLLLVLRLRGFLGLLLPLAGLGLLLLGALLFALLPVALRSGRIAASGANLLSSGVSDTVILNLMTFSMAYNNLPSVSSQNEKAIPWVPARAVRPMRCT